MNGPQRPTGQPRPTPLPPRRKRRIWLHVLLALVILLAGIVIGAGGATMVIHRAIASFVHHPERVAPRMAKHLTRKLDLSDEQAEQVEAIIQRRVDALMEIRRDINPRVAEELELLKAEMREVLDDRQYRRWEPRIEDLERILLHNGCGCGGRGHGD